MSESRIAVAYSGGRDSTALLHATLAVAAGSPVRVIALHVHHGLSPNADEWLAHCERVCRRWARAGRPVEFAAQRLSGAPGAGESVEAWARRERYAVLHSMARAQRAAVVLLAHHRRDQAETFLLQALRGAGVAGLAGMPRQVDRDGIVWQRPWLGKSRCEIDAYLRRHRLTHIDDESNADPRFARNRLRLQVWPALAGAFEAAESTLATSAAWAQEAHALLDEVAALDLEKVAVGAGLHLDLWRALSPARRSNSLRAWLEAHGAGAAPASLVVRLLDELPAARSGARWPFETAELRLYRGVLRREPLPARALPAIGSPEPRLHVDAAGRYPLPGWRGVLHVEPVRDGGVPLAWLARLDLRARAGREQFQSGPGRPPRGLKKQYQEAGVPEWARGGPLFFSGGQLVFVPGLGLDARVIGLPGQPLVTLRWVAGAHGEAADEAPGEGG